MAQKMNLQDQYLNAARKQRVEVSIFLVNGIKLNGIIRSFDNYIVLLASKAGNQMVYKHAISTVVPTAVFKFEPVLSDEPQIDHT